MSLIRKTKQLPWVTALFGSVALVSLCIAFYTATTVRTIGWPEISLLALSAVSALFFVSRLLAEKITKPLQQILALFHSAASPVAFDQSRMNSDELADRERSSENVAGLSHPLVQQILDSLPQAMYWKDSSLVYRGCNRIFVRLMGFRSREEIIGKTDQQLLRVGYRVGNHTDLDRRVLSGNAPIVHQIEHRSLPGGRDLWMDISKMPLLDATGNTVGVISSFEDITARKRADDALKTSENRSRTLFNASNDAILIIFGDVIVDCNRRACELFKKQSSEMIGMIPYQMVSSLAVSDEALWEENLERVLDIPPGAQISFPWQFQRNDGQQFETELCLNRMELSDQKFVIVFISDMTDRRRSEANRLDLVEKLEKAKRMESLALLAGGVAHDLNNMLGPLVAYPEMILEHLEEDSLIREDIVTIGRAAEQASTVIQDLLTLARRGRSELVPVYCRDIVTSYLSSPNFRELQQRQPNVVVESLLSSEEPPIMGSDSHLSKAIMNLVVNAFDAMPNGGKLTLSTQIVDLRTLRSGFDQIAKGRYLQLAVKDTGSGIDESDISKIFEPYYSKKKMGRSGSGLGLSVVYGIIKDHHGYYDIASEPDRGTEFLLYFPITSETPNNPKADLSLPEGSESILIVDDHPGQREVASRILRSLGYSVRVASTAEEAWSIIQSDEFELLVLDMILEGPQDGLDLYRQILTIQPEQRAIIVSGFSSNDRVEGAIRLGAGKFIKKPYTRQALAQAVREELDRKSVAEERAAR